MKRRDLLKSLGAIGLLPVIPAPALNAIATTAPAVSTTTYKWAEMIVRAHSKSSLSMLQRHLRLDATAAKLVHTQLVQNGVIAAQANAYGMHTAAKPLYDGAFIKPNSIKELVQNKLEETINSSLNDPDTSHTSRNLLQEDQPEEHQRQSSSQDSFEGNTIIPHDGETSKLNSQNDSPAINFLLNSRSTSLKELKNKTAIITGASKGIGASTAKRMGALGINVILAARSADQISAISSEINAAGGKAIDVPCDVSNYNAVAALVDRAKQEFGGLDILINNAGIIEPVARIADSDPEAWGKAIDINVKGVYNGIRAALPIMGAQGSGVIINISSGAATSALEGWSHYCSSKAAALSLTKCTHREVAEQNIRVIGLSPGTVATDMQVLIKASGINPVSQLDPSVHIPSQWVAEAICWLATEDAKEFDGDDVSLRDEEIRKRVGLS